MDLEIWELHILSEHLQKVMKNNSDSFICKVLFVSSGLLLDTVQNAFGFSLFLWYSVAGLAVLLHIC